MSLISKTGSASTSSILTTGLSGLILKSFGGQCPSFWLGPEPNKNGVWLWRESLLGNNQGSSVYTLLELSRNAFTTSIGMARMTSKSRRNSSQFTSVVTGAAGFLGSHLTDLLLARGHKVIGIDNFVTGTVDNISHLGGNPNFKFIQQDVTEFIFLDGAVDFVWHFASPASPIDYLDLPIQTLKVGSLGTHKALGLAKHKKARFLLASTSEIYGDPLVHPQNEEYWGNVNPIGLRSCYDEGKRCAETLFFDYYRQYNVDIKVARFFNTYGPKMHPRDGRV